MCILDKSDICIKIIADIFIQVELSFLIKISVYQLE